MGEEYWVRRANQEGKNWSSRSEYKHLNRSAAVVLRLNQLSRFLP